jgi:D-hydroxyproline dehydrogenase subunit alpha
MITFDGRAIEARVGMTLAAALAAAGITAFRRTRRGAPRGLFCGMGACQDCLVEIDGEANQRACMVRIDRPLAVRSQGFPPQLAAGDGEPAPTVAPQDVEILVVGGGAGGLTAAAVAAEAGAQVVLVDERPALGGQYYKQQVRSTLPQDRQFTAGRRLIERAKGAGVAFVEGAVWSASLPLQIAVYGPRGARTFRPSRLIVATGAIERPAPLPGWTLPGVMTTGAAQTLLRSYGVPAGRRVVVAGNGPLNLQLACELQRAGARVVAVAEAARRPGMWAARPFATMAAAAPDLLLQGAGYLRELRQAGVSIHWGCSLAAVEASPTGLVARLSDGTRFDADAVSMGYGFLPANELLRLLGCRHRYDPGRDQLVTERDPDCRTTVPGVLAVGDCCGLGGARAAEVEGVIAGAVAAGKPRSDGVARVRSILARQRRFQAGLWRLFAASCPDLAAADSHTIVCRCEEVTLAEIDAAMADGAASPAAVKRATRTGMGRCQGRYCGPLLAGLLHQRTGRPLDELSFFAPRPPIKPVPLAAIAGLEDACRSLP